MKTMILLVGIATLLAGCVAVPVPATNYNTSTYHSPVPSNTTTYQLPQSPPMITTTQQPRVIPAVAVNKPIPAATSPIPHQAVIPKASVNTDQPPTISVTANPAPMQTVPSTPKPLPAVTNNVQSPTHGKLRQLDWLAQRIHQNQNGGDTQQLVKWNDKEQFVSLGIGQLTWYPAGKKGRFRETFPEFLNYAKTQKANIPPWIAQRPARGGPWRSKAHFHSAQNDTQMRELRTFIGKTLNLQANFMALRLEQAIPQMLQELPPNQRERVHKNYLAVANTPGGLYPLLDYSQFKGLGLNPAERYQNQGWGLLQVLQNMDKVEPGAAALAEFMRAADDVLVTRIANAPSDYREARFLTDWLKRINTYRPTQQARR